MKSFCLGHPRELYTVSGIIDYIHCAFVSAKESRNEKTQGGCREFHGPHTPTPLTRVRCPYSAGRASYLIIRDEGVVASLRCDCDGITNHRPPGITIVTSVTNIATLKWGRRSVGAGARTGKRQEIHANVKQHTFEVPGAHSVQRHTLRVLVQKQDNTYGVGM